jgi:hypothetical protein
MIVAFCSYLSCGGTLSRLPRRGSAFWPVVLGNAVIYASFWLIWHLRWKAQLVAWPASAGILAWLIAWGRSVAAAEAAVPAVGELRAVELPAAGRTGERSAAAPVRAAGTVTVRDAIRNSWRARRWQPAGDPEADRGALLAGQAFRVAALRRIDGRWRRGRLDIGGRPLAVTWDRGVLPLTGPRRARRAPSPPLAPPARIVLTRQAAVTRERLPANDWLFTVITVSTPDGYEMLAIPTIDVPLVHAALELANAELANAEGDGERGAAHVAGRGPV